MPEALPAPRAGFARLDQSSVADWRLISGEFKAFADRLPDRLMDDLVALVADPCGFPLDRLSHSLQTATRALRDGRDEEYVVCALLHDIGEASGPYNHPEIAAAILRPFVSARNHWMVEHHGVFQGYYYFDKVGGNRDAREAHRGNPHFDHTAEFCALYDQVSFDPDYPSLPLEAFAPMLRRVLARPIR